MGFLNRLFESAEAKAARLERNRIEKERRDQSLKEWMAKREIEDEQERVWAETKNEAKSTIEAEHRNVSVSNYRIRFGIYAYVSPNFPTNLCASCGTPGNFPLVSISATDVHKVGLGYQSTTHSISLPRCPNCNALKITKPSLLAENQYKNLHSAYVEVLKIANPDISNSSISIFSIDGETRY